MQNILIIYGIPKDIVNAIMMLYSNTSAMARSPHGDTSYFEITTGLLQGDTLALKTRDGIKDLVGMNVNLLRDLEILYN